MKNKILSQYNKFREISLRYLKKEKYEKFMRTVYIMSGYMYTFNQIYQDDITEKRILHMVEKILPAPKRNHRNEKEILFFDSYGNDYRGLAYIYVKALIELGYNISYVVRVDKKESILRIRNLIGEGNVNYIVNANLVAQTKEIYEIIETSSCKKAFLYFTPDDVAAISAFARFNGVLDRYLINLTDHAFWLGKCAFDYLIEFREYGARISLQQRNIDESQIRILPFYPQIVKNSFQGFPFDSNGKKVIFSGGHLYKTFDEYNTYYSLVERIISRHVDVVFYYLGNGDQSELQSLQRKYPQQVFYGKEREDVFEIIRHSYFYLSTYPYAGGLMTQYACLAKKIPLTLVKKGNKLEGAVQIKNVKWRFNKMEEICEYIDFLVENESYLKEQEQKMQTDIIGEQEFRHKLENIVLNKKHLKVENIPVDVTEFMEHPLENLSFASFSAMFCRKKGLFMFIHFPRYFVRGFIKNFWGV